jgi:hypothetical protein
MAAVHVLDMEAVAPFVWLAAGAQFMMLWGEAQMLQSTHESEVLTRCAWVAQLLAGAVVGALVSSISLGAYYLLQMALAWWVSLLIAAGLYLVLPWFLIPIAEIYLAAKRR